VRQEIHGFMTRRQWTMAARQGTENTRLIRYLDSKGQEGRGDVAYRVVIVIHATEVRPQAAQ